MTTYRSNLGDCGGLEAILVAEGALSRLQSKASQPPSVARAMRPTICEAKVRGVTCKLEDVTDQLSSDKGAENSVGQQNKCQSTTGRWQTEG